MAWIVIMWDDGMQGRWEDETTYVPQPNEITYPSWPSMAQLDADFPNHARRVQIVYLEQQIIVFEDQNERIPVLRRAILGDTDALEELQDMQDLVDGWNAEIATLQSQMV